MKAPQYNSSLRKRFLAFAAALVLLFALVFELYPRSSQIIDLSTGSGLSRMLRYDDAQVYIFGEIHRKVEYQKFRNVLFKYLVEKKGVRVLLMEHGYASGFIENETDDLFRCVRSVYDIPRGLRIIPVDVGIQPKQTGQ